MAIGCPICNRRRPPSRARNDSDTKIGRSSSNDAVTDSATITAATAQPSPVGNHDSHPSSGPSTSIATGLYHKPVTTLSTTMEAELSPATQDGEEGSKGNWYHPRGQTQVDHQSVGDDEAEEGGYHGMEMETCGTSEEEEDRYDSMDECLDEPDDEDLEDADEDLQEDDDDDDWEDCVDWESHNLFWFGVRELTWTPLPPLKSILKKPAAEDTSSTTPHNQAADEASGRRRVTFRNNMPSYRWEKGANAPYWKRARSRSPILLGFH
ncbi:hypothetical protein KVR01_000953 [Diaporthe batatas]|uniref:uncharacterized protein n=1 Tax=Diaporthe batatas TaxID=748121 RepID=UPI001D038DEE|nr:uncharacterized protein KVR01_000953 [Diaporthe batatas]KAG8170208.1 hypothetical protein KVR01_000953 [Diaporthe batatas]